MPLPPHLPLEFMPRTVGHESEVIRMQRTEASPTNLQIVLGAGAGAGLLAVLLAALDREEQDIGKTEVRQVTGVEHRQKRGRRGSENSEDRVSKRTTLIRAVGGRSSEATKTTGKDARSGVRERKALQRAERSARKAVDQGRRTAQVAKERLGGLSVDGTGEVAQRVSRTAQRVGGQAATAVQSSAKQAAGVAETGLERAREASSLLGGASRNRWSNVSRIGDQITPAALSVAGQVSSAASTGAERAKEAGSLIASTAKERVPEMSQRVTSEVVPSLRDLAVQAASTALDLWDTTRERAAEAAEIVQADLRPQAVHAAQAVAASSVKAKEASTVVTGKAGEVGGRAKAVSRQAADATVETGRDTGAMLFWGAAAGSLIYYALLGPEERERVTSAVQSVTGQVRELIKDFQGYDEEF